MTWYRPILGLGRPLADRDHVEDTALSSVDVVVLGQAHQPSGAQVPRELLLQHAARLSEEAAIDRFVEYLHVQQTGKRGRHYRSLSPKQGPGSTNWQRVVHPSRTLPNASTGRTAHPIAGTFSVLVTCSDPNRTDQNPP